jgi:hypothetical protein
MTGRSAKKKNQAEAANELVYRIAYIVSVVEAAINSYIVSREAYIA